MRTVNLLRGISGAGKSTFTKANFPNAVVCSADTYFIGSDGVYRFNPALLGLAHKACFKRFEVALQQGVDEVVVDNTNTTLREMKGYVETAAKYGYDLKVFRLVVDPAIAAARNQHGVPADKVQAMQDRFQDFEGEEIVDTTPVSV